MEILRRTLKAYVIVICVFLLLTVILAAVIQFTAFKENWAFGGLVVILSITALLTGIMEGNIVGKKGLLVGIASAIVLILMILFAVGGVFAGSFGVRSFSAFYLIPIITGAIGGILGANSGK